MNELDSPERLSYIRKVIEKKKPLQTFYREVYRKYNDTLKTCPTDGMALELGSGGGFIKEVIPEIITSDVIPYAGIDRVINAMELPFNNDSIRFIAMMDVIHHLPNVRKFFDEANRCLKKNGKIFIVDQYYSWVTYPLYKFLHHEPMAPKASKWEFESTGPLSDANAALAWIVFERDRKIFETLYPNLRINKIQHHSPIRYWITGGMKNWTLMPNWSYSGFKLFDGMLCKISNRFASFIDIEIEKI